MTKISGSTGALIQGVSQQPEGQRLPGQCWEQINWQSSASDGLVRRPPTKLKAVLPLATPDGVATYFYRRGDTEEYTVTIEQNGTLRVWDKDYVERTVSVTNAAYLTPPSGTPIKEVLRFHTIGDVTFIANKSKKIALGTAKSDPAPAEAIINCMKGNYARAYKVSVTWTKDGVSTNTSVTYTTRDSSNAANEVDIAADNIATNLYNGLVAALTTAYGWTVTRMGNVIYLKRVSLNTDPSQFTIGSYDGNNDNDMVVITKSVAKYSNLPNRAVNGYTVQVQGKTGDDFNDYWIKFEVNPESEDGRGKWKECLAPNLVIAEDATTMPHLLLRKANGTFKFGPAVENFDVDLPNMNGWVGRQCGDDDTNPWRSYVGYGVNDIGTFQDRLVLLCDENVVMSRTRDYLNFYKESATESTDADPLDFASSENEVANLERMCLFNGSLTVFSPNTEFVVPGEDPIKASTAVLQPKSAFNASLKAAPVPSGSNVFFATEYGDYSGIREFFIEQQTDQGTSTLTTQHADRYLAGDVVNMAGSTNMNVLLVQTSQDEHIIYNYDYYWQGQKKVQSSWSKWVFPSNVEGMHINRTDAIFLVRGDSGTGLYVIVMDLTRKPTEDCPFTLRMDFMQQVEIVNGAFTLPANVVPAIKAEADVEVIAVGCNDTGIAGRNVVISRVDDTHYTLLDTSLTGHLWVGVSFESYYRLTMPMVTDTKGHALLASRQQLMYLLFNVSESGAFDVFTTVFGQEYLTQFEPFILEVTDLVDSEPPLATDTFKVPIRAEARDAKCEIKVSSHLPVSIADIEWVVNMRQKGRRV